MILRAKLQMLLAAAGTTAAIATTAAAARAPPPALPWAPPPADSPELLGFLRNTSRPKLAYSTYIGWYEDGGLNESSLFGQVE